MSDRPVAVIVLAAGQGTRMKSATPKVLHAIGGRTLLGHVLAAVEPLDAEQTLVVVGHGRDQVVAALAERQRTRPVVQAEQRGTGDAVRIALDEAGGELSGTIVVVPGDTPLLTGESLRRLLDHHASHGNAATLLTAKLADPTGYGRVVRASDGSVQSVVEHKDADGATRAIREINTSIYAFDGAALAATIAEVGSDNAQGEHYLTDVVALLVRRGDRVGALLLDDADEVTGVNDRAQLAHVGAILRDRIVTALMRSGVTVIDPATTWIDATVVVEPDATIAPFTILRGRTVVQAGATVGPQATISDTVVGPGATVLHTVADGADIGAGTTVGPFAYLRPGAVLHTGAKVGTFVEVKNSELGVGAKVPHLTYVGDATIGEGTNIGASSVFVNYDGVAKHRTTIGAHCRTGSDTMFVAPVTVGDGAYTAAGSVITEPVPPGAMAVARARQRNIEGWVERRRPGTPAAEAARRALSSSDGEN